MIRNVVTNTRPILVHAPGKGEYLPLWKDIKENALLYPPRCQHIPSLSIVTFNNGGLGYNGKEPGLFERSVELAGLRCDVLGTGIQNWQNRFKIDLLDDYLYSLRTEFVLVADSSDVVIVNDLAGLVPIFLRQNCWAFFNAERIVWPPDLREELVQFEQERHQGCYLNAGLWIAHTSKAKEIIKSVKRIATDTCYLGSEQAYFKGMYFQMAEVIGVDARAVAFQGLNRVDADEVRITKIF